jgi:hypothetical protein
MYGVPDGPQCLILRLLRSRTQPRKLDSCYGYFIADKSSPSAAR